MKVVGRQAMQEVDRRAAAEYGVPTLLLMENAGAAVARRASALLGHRVSGRRVVVVAGSGNNGGDGLVAARRLAAAGARVLAIMAAEGGPESPRLSEDARFQYGLARSFGVEVAWMGEAGADPVLEGAVASADLVVDAVLGTGSRGAPRGRALAAIELMAKARGPVLAVDIPSGVDADTGQVPGAAVRAVETVTFGFPKPGLLIFPGAALCGRIWVAEIGFPPALLAEAPPAVELLEAETVASWLPRRPPDAHKGTFGHVLVVAGSRGMAGAGAMAARSALVAGAGLVTWGVPASLQDAVAPMVPEALTVGLPDGGSGRLAAGAAAAVLELLSTRDVLLIGPGLGTHPETAEAVLAILGAWQGPAVVDADALNILAASSGRPDAGPPQFPQAPTGPPGRTDQGTPARILTPHPGEMARLLGRSVRAIQEDRVAAAREAARRFGAVVVLKGARTVIADPPGNAWLNPAASAALATGGSGDVLSGVAAAFLAQGLGAAAAAACACFVHGLAGVLAAEGGEAGVTAADISRHVGAAMRLLVKQGEPMPPGMEPVRVLPL